MWSWTRFAGLVLSALGLGLLAWLLYDATMVRESLGLGRFLSEGAVATAGLLAAAASVAAGLLCWRRAGGREPR